MNRALLGWFLLVRARKGAMLVRFLPSGPMARSSNSRICPSAARSSRSSATSGWAFACPRKVSSDKSNCPDSSIGHGMPRATSHRANLSRLNTVPSNTP